MTKVAIIYFGISRFPSKTIGSIYKNIIEPNEKNGISFKFLSFINCIDNIFNPRSGEYDINIDKRNILDIPSDYYFIIRQEKRNIYHELKYIQKRKDVFDDGWLSINNLLNQLYILKSGWNSFKAVSKENFDAYLFLRPDLLYIDRIDIKNLLNNMTNNNSILLPSWHSWGGVNDRCALARPNAAKYYALRFNEVKKFSSNNDLHSETFLAWTLEKRGCYIGNLPLKAKRVRANGYIKNENFQDSCIFLPEKTKKFWYNMNEKKIIFYKSNVFDICHNWRKLCLWRDA